MKNEFHDVPEDADATLSRALIESLIDQGFVVLSESHGKPPVLQIERPGLYGQVQVEGVNVTYTSYERKPLPDGETAILPTHNVAFYRVPEAALALAIGALLLAPNASFSAAKETFPLKQSATYYSTRCEETIPVYPEGDRFTVEELTMHMGGEFEMLDLQDGTKLVIFVPGADFEHKLPVNELASSLADHILHASVLHGDILRVPTHLLPE